MLPYVNNYKILLVEARKNDLVLHTANNTDLFHLLEIILDKIMSKNEATQKAIQYRGEYKTDKSVIMTIAGYLKKSLIRMLLTKEYSIWEDF